MESIDPTPAEHQEETQPSEDKDLLDQVLLLMFNDLPTTDLFSPEQIEKLRQLADAGSLHRPERVIEILQAE
ncbi:MAG: hypothetical protein IH957_11390 [Chloroflexi bacterium]|nr:hypothetical protein [Chloroflexota bacterium]